MQGGWRYLCETSSRRGSGGWIHSQGWRSAAGRDENPWYRQKGGPRPGRGAGNMQISAPFQGNVTYNAAKQ